MKPNWIQWILGVVVTLAVGIASAGFVEISALKVKMAEQQTRYEYISKSLDEIKVSQQRLLDKIERIENGKLHNDR